jgi:hypothetical protein
VELYIQSPIRLHGVVLNRLSTGTASPFTLPYNISWVRSKEQGTEREVKFLHAYKYKINILPMN